MFHRAKVTVCFVINTAHTDAVWAERKILRGVRKISKSDSYFLHVYPSVSLSAGSQQENQGWKKIKNEHIKEIMGVKRKPDIIDIIEKKRLQ